MSDRAVAKLTIAPHAADWSLDHNPTAEASRFREQLGLPTDRPIVMSGHQATFWHPGILAKLMAADALARRDDAHAAWLVVDQDDTDPLEIRCPVLGDDALDVASVQLGDGAGPTGWREAARDIVAPDLSYASPGVAQGMRALCDAMRSHEDSSSLAAQVTKATADLLSPLDLKPSFIHARSLTGTDAFQELVSRMLDDPKACARAYNDAISAHPDAGMRPLRIDDRVELPLWVIREGQRSPAFADDVEGAVPRALMMTGIVRLVGCDLFIHGTGGGGEDGYESAGAAWLLAWLDEPHLAPVTVASATMRLSLPGGPAPSESEVADAKARAHKARHDPAIIGDDETAREKQEIVEQIAIAKKAGENPAALFQRMQSLLEDYRATHAGEFERLDEQATLLERRAGEAEIREDRTWSFPLHDTLDELKDAIGHEFGVT